MYLTILLLKMYKPKKLVEKQQLNRTLTTSEQIALFNYVLVFFKHTFFKHNILNTRSFGLTRYLKRLCVCVGMHLCVMQRGGGCAYTHPHPSLLFCYSLFLWRNPCNGNQGKNKLETDNDWLTIFERIAERDNTKD